MSATSYEKKNTRLCSPITHFPSTLRIQLKKPRRELTLCFNLIRVDSYVIFTVKGERVSEELVRREVAGIRLFLFALRIIRFF